VKLLQEPRLGRLHRAGLHTILAHSPNDPLWHADEARRIYENLYPEGTTPTAEQAVGYKQLLEDAKAVQAMAREAEETRKKPTEEEEDDWTEQYLTALEEEGDRFWDGEADVVDHGDDDDEEEVLDVAEAGEAVVKAEAEAEAEAEASTAEDDEMVYGSAWDPKEKQMMRPTREESPARPEVFLH
jgi:hypothetical protein